MSITNKPWGSYEDYFRNPECVMKKIIIRAGHCISYQKHNKRGEFWFVASGNPVLKISVSLNNPMVEFTQSILRTKETIEIPPRCCHQLSAPLDGGDVVIYEMQFGECSEDDIERLDDPYNRD